MGAAGGIGGGIGAGASAGAGAGGLDLGLNSIDKMMTTTKAESVTYKGKL